MLVAVRTVGVEEELLVVDPSGRPVPLGPAALEVAARRGEGETVEEHDRAERGDDEAGGGDPVGRLVPELKTQQLEFGTRVCTVLDDVAADLRHWRGGAGPPRPARRGPPGPLPPPSPPGPPPAPPRRRPPPGGGPACALPAPAALNVPNYASRPLREPFVPQPGTPPADLLR